MNLRAVGDWENEITLARIQPAREVAPMPWLEILMLAIGVALLVAMICGRQGSDLHHNMRLSWVPARGPLILRPIY